MSDPRTFLFLISFLMLGLMSFNNELSLCDLVLPFYVYDVYEIMAIN